MNTVFRLKRIPAGILTVLGAVICASAGTAMPLYCIGLGLLMGCYIGRREQLRASGLLRMLHRSLFTAIAASGLTVLIAAFMWMPWLRNTVSPQTGLVNTGFLMVLLSQQASFENWFILMVALSPLLQLMATVFACQCTLLVRIGVQQRVIEQMRILDLIDYRQKADAIASVVPLRHPRQAS